MNVSLTLNPPVGFILRQSGAFRAALDNLEPLWERFKPIMSAIEQEQFDSHGHGAWPPLAASTLRYKTGPDILVETGDLKASLIDPGRAARTSAREMVWGTDVAYAHFHQDGGSIAGRPPQRKVIDVRVEERQRFEQATVQWVNEVAARTWGAI